MNTTAPRSTLRPLRRARKLSVRAAAAKLDVSHASLSRIEMGLQVPRLALARRIAKLYQITLDEVFRGHA